MTAGTSPLEAELEALRLQLAELAAAPGETLTSRYRLQPPPLAPGFHWRVRRLAARMLRPLQALIVPRNPWPPALRHASTPPGAQPLLIWAMGTDRDTLREACRGFAKLEATLPGFAPVLITDVADFAFFSRLRWLVEFVPELSGDGESYRTRKLRFLARLYREAPVLPVSAGLQVEAREDEIRRWIGRR